MCGGGGVWGGGGAGRGGGFFLCGGWGGGGGGLNFLRLTFSEIMYPYYVANPILSHK